MLKQSVLCVCRTLNLLIRPSMFPSLAWKTVTMLLTAHPIILILGPLLLSDCSQGLWEQIMQIKTPAEASSAATWPSLCLTAQGHLLCWPRLLQALGELPKIRCQGIVEAVVSIPRDCIPVGMTWWIRWGYLLFTKLNRMDSCQWHWV